MLELLAYFVANALVLNAPLILVVLVVRHRIGPRLAPLLIAAGFAAATAFAIWRMEWFDVGRHGMPSVGYLLTSMGPYCTGFGACGWVVGRLIARKRPRRYAPIIRV